MSITRSRGPLNHDAGIESNAVGQAVAEPRPAGADVEVAPVRPQRRRFSADYKRSIIRQADACSHHGELGSLLRREGLYSSTLANFRKQLAEGHLAEVNPDGKRSQRRAVATERQSESRKIARLEREVEQLRTIIEVQKKLSELLNIPLENQELTGRRGC